MAITPQLIKIKRCPLCATRLTQQADGSWICPNCGWYEPVI